jgi:alpha-glucosidase
VCFYGDGDEMHLPFNFFLAQVPRRDAGAFRQAVDEVEHACGAHWPTLVLSNHDVARACDRYAGDGDRDAVARLLVLMLLTLRGTPFLYYGEEIGMRTADPAGRDDVRDPVGQRFWPLYKGRDGARRPTQWTAAPGGGFTDGTPWLTMAPDAPHRTVEGQLKDERSLLSFYQTLLQIRRSRTRGRRRRSGPSSCSTWPAQHVPDIGCCRDRRVDGRPGHTP